MRSDWHLLAVNIDHQPTYSCLFRNTTTLPQDTPRQPDNTGPPSDQAVTRLVRQPMESGHADPITLTGLTPKQMN